MNKMIKFFKDGVSSYVKNMGRHQYLRITGDCTFNVDSED